ncbi:Protein mlo2 [Yarrowia sp. C11]|nr:Protein mlo2 [Yarrowia sp. C11]KAG5364697.1 Protein mlo2 [Yarrowia sp. E02]
MSNTDIDPEKGKTAVSDSLPVTGETAEETVTAGEFLERQLQLERDAKEAMPYDPSECTFYTQPARQLLFTCLTCSRKNHTPSVICYGCSIQCHSSHELVELFTKRNMTCDCGTSRMKSFGGCNLRKNFSQLDEPCDTNTYNHNFEGRFCFCDKPYNEETDIMYQCLMPGCGEDWYHDVCIGIPGKKAHPPGVNVFDSLTEVQEHEEIAEDHEFVCYRCVEKVPRLKVIWDLPGVVRVRLEPVSGKASAFSEKKEERSLDLSEDSGQISEPKSEENSESKSDFKSTDATSSESTSSKTESGTESGADSGTASTKPFSGTTAVKSESTSDATSGVKSSSGSTSVASSAAKHPLSSPSSPAAKKSSLPDTPQNLFLASNFRQIVSESKDPTIFGLTLTFPFLAEEEQVYEPPSDDDAGSSLLDAGTSALHKIPRQQAIDGMAAYNQIKDRLAAFFKPFAEGGKVVTDQDVTGFFEEMKKK